MFGSQPKKGAKPLEAGIESGTEVEFEAGVSVEGDAWGEEEWRENGVVTVGEGGREGRKGTFVVPPTVPVYMEL